LYISLPEGGGVAPIRMLLDVQPLNAIDHGNTMAQL